MTLEETKKECDKVEHLLQTGKSVSVERLREAAYKCLVKYKDVIERDYKSIHTALLQLYTSKRAFETTRPNETYDEPKTVKLPIEQLPKRHFNALRKRFTSSSRN